MRGLVGLLTFAVLSSLSTTVVADTTEPLVVKGALSTPHYGASAPYDLAASSAFASNPRVKISWDPSKGSQDAITRVASGVYDVGVTDVSTLIDFASKNEDVAPKIVFLSMARSPKLIITFKAAGIKQPKDLIGKTLASGQADGASQIYPLFLARNGLSESQIKREIVDIRLRDAMLPRGQVDGIICYDYTTVFNLQKVGVKIDDLSMMYFWDHGLDPYGIAVVASRKFADEHPEELKTIVSDISRAWVASIKNPDLAIDAISQIEPTVNKEIELDRLKWVNNTSVVTSVTRKQGLGFYDASRMQATIDEVVAGLNLSRKPSIDEIYDDRFLPDMASRAISE